MTRCSIPRVWALALLAVLGGCSIPQPVLDDAKLSGQLAQQMQVQIDVFTRDQQAAAQRRLQWINLLEEQKATQDAALVQGSQVMQAAGMTGRARLAVIVQALAASQVASDQQLQATKAGLKAQNDKIVAIAPSTLDSVSKLEKDLVPLQKQRATRETLDFLKAYYTTTKADLAQAAAAAESSASAASSANGAALSAASAAASPKPALAKAG